MTNLSDPILLDIRPLAEISQRRNSNTLLLAASVLEMDALPKLYEILTQLPQKERLDVVLYGRGGEIVAARRFAILLHKFCTELTFIIPYHCQSTMTALSLSGHHIIAGDMALFSAIDPALQCEEQGALASEDLRLFAEMGQKWFGIDSEEARSQLLSALASSIFPTTLTSLYRSTLEVADIAKDLLAMGAPDISDGEQQKIVDKLLYGYHSHSYAPTNDDLKALGLPIVREQVIEQVSWQLVMAIQSIHGGTARDSHQDPRNDFILATPETAWVRQHYPGGFGPSWQRCEITDDSA